MIDRRAQLDRRGRTGISPGLRSWGPLAGAIALGAGLAGAYVAGGVAVDLNVDGRRVHVRTHAATVADLLVEQRVDVAPGDVVVPSPDTRLVGGEHVRIERARALKIRADGRTVRLRSQGRSARAVLTDAGIPLGRRDRVHVNGQPWPLDAALAGAGGTGGREPPDPVPDLKRPPYAFLDGMRHLLAGMPALPHPPVASAAGPEDDPPPGASPGDSTGGTDPSHPDRRPSAPRQEPRVDARTAIVGADARWTIDVWREAPLTVSDDGVAFTVTTAGATVAEGLAAAGIEVLPGDELYPAGEAALTGVTQVAIWRATPFLVETEDTTTEARAFAATVGEALADAGMPLLGRDYSIPAADTPLEPNLLVKVIRVHEDTQVVDVEIPYEVVTQPDPELPLDETRLLQAGTPGRKTQHVKITYENGEPVGREVVEETVHQAPVAEQVAYGTQVVWRTIETEEGPKQYWRKLRMYATSYSPARAGTPVTAPWYGRTRSGFVLRKGIVATDPRIIPLGMWVYVPGYGVAIAGDTGGGVKNYMIDLGYEDHDYQSWHWPVDVYILDRLPPEHQMRWILP